MSLFIFDLDGTLIDSLKDLAISGNYALTKHGFAIHQEDSYKIFVGNGVKALIERALPLDTPTDMVSKVLTTFIEHYEKHGHDYTKPYAGIQSLLRQLKAGGHLISIASNKYHTAVLSLVETYFPDIEFDLVLGHRDGRPAKPNPDIVLDTLIQLSTNNDDCYYLGDSSVDMCTANAAKVKAIGVTWGFRSEKELRTSGADAIIHHPSELMNCVKKFLKR